MVGPRSMGGTPHVKRTMRGSDSLISGPNSCVKIRRSRGGWIHFWVIIDIFGAVPPQRLPPPLQGSCLHLVSQMLQRPESMVPHTSYCLRIATMHGLHRLVAGLCPWTSRLAPKQGQPRLSTTELCSWHGPCDDICGRCRCADPRYQT